MTTDEKKRQRRGLARSLRNRGFDRCRMIPIRDGGGIRVGCSQCQALCINGFACHETGCPNERRE